MCRPDYYGIKYVINPWMALTHTVDHTAALSQWNTLYQTILECGATIDLVQPARDWPDMVFTANAGLLYRGKIILSHFKYPERQGELPYYETWFKSAGFQIINPSSFFEGAGDALFAGSTLFAGYGFRTERRFYEQATYLDQQQLIYCELTDPYFYHIDTCFCPLNDKLAIWYPDAFTAETQKRIQQHIELIPVAKQEAMRFACNAVVLNQHVILPADCPEIATTLEQRGYIIHICKMDEYLKAGGACKCLTLRLD